MFKINVETTRGPATITSMEEFNDLGSFTVTGPGRELAKTWIEEAHGAFGHTIDKYAAPCDLHAAAMRLEQEPEDEVRFVSIEGEVKEYDSGVPDGSCT